MKNYKNKILVINGDSYYAPFKKFGSLEHNPRILDYNPESVLLAVFTGGSDVDPSFYQEKRAERTYCNPARDTYESEIFRTLAVLQIPMFGICRGSQFLCVMAGGKLCQHLDNHGGGTHLVLTNDGRNIKFNSYHHQMMLPEGVSHIVLAHSVPRLSKSYINGDDAKILDVPYEYEAVYFNDINAVGVQYHPEMMQEQSEGFQYCVELTEKLLNNEIVNQKG